MLRSVGVAISVVALFSACTSSPAPPADRGHSPTTNSDPPPVAIRLQMSEPRAVHRATTLEDGRVLLTGGCTAPGCGGFDEARHVELYDPALRTFKAGPEMLHASASGTATLLDDGRVLLTGGYPAEGAAPTSAAELYDPARNRFVPAAAMTSPRADQTATLMGDGRVLIAGGYDASGTALDTTEFYDPQSGAFSPGPRLSEARAAQCAVAVGRAVVLIGGTRTGGALRSTDILENGRWRPGPDLKIGRVKLGCAVLPGERILVIGGATSTEGRRKLISTEVVSLGSGRSRYGPNLSEGEYKLDGAVVSLGRGRVAIAGGNRVDVYDARSDAIETLARPDMGRRSFISATIVDTDSLLVGGGYDDSIPPPPRHG